MRLGDLDDLKVHISELMLVYSGTELDNAILKAIDNAPTVIWCNETSDGLPLMDLRPRPQGEWLTHRVAFYLTCPFCGCNLRALKNEVFLDTDDDYNFCPNCGAEMKLKPRDCEHCKHSVEKDGSQGCEVWECEFEKRSDL